MEQAILIIRSAVANSVDWEELGRIVQEEKKQGDPIAKLISKLKLATNEVISPRQFRLDSHLRVAADNTPTSCG